CLPRARNCSLQSFLRSGRDSAGGSRRDNCSGRTDEARTFKEIAAAGTGGMAAVWHESSLGRQNMPRANRQIYSLIKFRPRLAVPSSAVRPRLRELALSECGVEAGE